MARSTITLDFKANTAKAMASFRSFSDDLTKKFLVSGLKLDMMKNAINEINREFDKALGEQGMKSASELKQLEASTAAVFSALKGGSLDAGREMAKNIRIALGEVSKSIGSTTEDINSVMRTIPVTAENVLSAYGVTMEEFASMNLRMVTNSRDAFGEDAAKLLEGILAGDVGIQQLNEDRTGIGQLVRTKLPGMDFASMSMEGRTAAVLQLLQDEEFQSQIEAIAEDNAGFKRTVASFRNTLFDPRTGVVGILKEVTLELADFTGDKSVETTSIFDEINRLFKVLFSPTDGLFATIAKSINEVFGGGEDAIAEIFVRMIRWISNLINSIKPFFESDIFKSFIGIIKIIFDAFSGFISAFTGVNLGDFSFDFKGVIEKITQIIESITEFLVGGMNRIKDYFDDLTFDGEGILSVLGGLFTTIFTSVKLLLVNGFETITSVLGSLIRNFGGWENIGSFLMEMIDSLKENVMEIVQAFFDMLMSDDLDLAGFVDVGLDVLAHFADALVDVIELVIANFSQLKDKIFPDGFERIGRELGKIASRLIPVVVELFSEIMTPIREVIRGFFMELIEHFFGVTENISRPIADFLTNFVLMADPGGIISNILGMVPIFGDTLVGIYKFINFITDTVGGLLGDLLPWGQKIAGTAITNQLQDVTYNAAENIEKNEDISGGDFPGEFSKELLKKGGDLITLPTRASRTVLKEATGLPDWIIDGIPLPFYSGNIPQIARAAGGMNLKNILAEEIAHTRPGIKPVIANSDEIIIPPGRLNELRMVTGDQVSSVIVQSMSSIREDFNFNSYKLDRLVDSLAKLISGIEVGLSMFLGGPRIENRFLGNLFQSISNEVSNTRPGAKPVIANSDEIIIPPGRLSELRLFTEERIIKGIRWVLGNNILPFISSQGTLNKFDEFIKEFRPETLIRDEEKQEAPIIIDTLKIKENLNALKGGIEVKEIKDNFSSLTDFSKLDKLTGLLGTLITNIQPSQVHSVLLSLSNATENKKSREIYSAFLDNQSPSYINSLFEELSENLQKNKLKDIFSALLSQVQDSQIENGLKSLSNSTQDSIFKEIYSYLSNSDKRELKLLNVFNSALRDLRKDQTEQVFSSLSRRYSNLENKFSGNLLESMNNEISNVRPLVRPVIANSDEIIIPPGRLHEFKMVTEQQIRNLILSFSPPNEKEYSSNEISAQESILSKLIFSISSLFEPKSKEDKEIVESNTEKSSIKEILSDKINTQESILSKVIFSINSLMSNEKKEDKEVIESNTEKSSIKEILSDKINTQDILISIKNIISEIYTLLSGYFIEKQNSIELEETLFEGLNTFKENLDKQIEDTWIPSVESTSSFFVHLENSVRNWKLDVDRISMGLNTINTPSLSVRTPSVSVPDIKIGNVDLDEEVGNKMQSQWNRVYNFFRKAGEQSDELRESWGDKLFNVLGEIGRRFRGGEKEKEEETRPNTLRGIFNRNNFLGNVSLNSIEREQSLSSPSSDIIIANGEEIVAPSSMLVSLAELLYDKSTASAKNNSPSINQNNTFNIEIIANNANAENIAQEVKDVLNKEFMVLSSNTMIPIT